MTLPYNGPERRKVPEASLEAVITLLMELNTKFEAHLEEEKHIRPHLAELVDILQKSKGVLIFFKFLFYIGAPIGALIYWIKDHVKL